MGEDFRWETDAEFLELFCQLARHAYPALGKMQGAYLERSDEAMGGFEEDGGLVARCRGLVARRVALA